MEWIVRTGEGDPSGSHSALILRISDGKAEIIGAFRGSFGVVTREGEWDDIIIYEPRVEYPLIKVGLRFDGSKYVRIWKYEQKSAGAEPVEVKLGDETP